MDISLTPHEARVVGCLLEKQRTTPEHYPLSLNSLTSACNQKTNRDPVLELDEATVQDTIDTLMKKHYVSEKSGFGSRVPKYQHRFCNTEFGTLKFSEQELGVVCVLLLRGPQTPGELRTRTERLCKFQDVHEVESVLDRLMRRDDGPFVAQLPRESGKREARYAQLFSDTPEIDVGRMAVETVSAGTGRESDRIGHLEQQLDRLREEVATLRARLDRLSPEQDA
ncbi:MAG TPA: DUF480 domain-containing protein [Gammaproteobacteria bacterium]|nr:DUF480 domain-containing protein [Gammaproteobacteria bacterium]